MCYEEVVVVSGSSKDGTVVVLGTGKIETFVVTAVSEIFLDMYQWISIVQWYMNHMDAYIQRSSCCQLTSSHMYIIMEVNLIVVKSIQINFQQYC